MGGLFRMPVLAVLISGCTAWHARYPLADPMWEDPDDHHVDMPAEDGFSPPIWDVVDQTFFQPTLRFMAANPADPAVNVNAWDEVPDSSWFENRIGRGDMTPEQAAAGACTRPLDPTGPWTVVRAKPNGADPGFIIVDQTGQGYLLKFDGHEQQERGSSADVIGSRLYHAFGYHAPCNQVVYFDPAILQVAQDARSEDELGRKIPMTDDDVAYVLDHAQIGRPGTDVEGLHRAAASEFLTGVPLGPWTYQGIRKDDPNDVIPHEDRRDIRAARIMAAWINHIDAREQNSLRMYVTEDGRSYVKHHYIDFGDGFGLMWDNDELARRFGYSYGLDFADTLADLFTLGAVRREWDHASIDALAPEYGYYSAELFEADQWKNGYPNPAFARMRPEDGAWAARIVAAFTDAHLEAILAEARISNPVSEAQLMRLIAARRDAILAHYLTIRSPLADFEVDGTRLCGTDLATVTGVLDPRLVTYEARMYFLGDDTPRWVGASEQACASLAPEGQRPAAAAEGKPPDDPARYAILDWIVVPVPGADPLPPARLHFYDLGEDGFRLVGIERPANDAPPAIR